jgi:NitT/TauT family transport system ATP-binding protein
MTESFVDLADVSLRYTDEAENDTLAVEKLSLRVARGEFLAVVGPSGCGKSTLMKLVTGLLPPTSGTVALDGRPVRDPVPGVGMAFQNPTLMPWRTTLDNILLPFEIIAPHKHRLRSQRSEYVLRAERLLELVSLAGAGTKFPWQLSGGMQQRASLCRAIVHEPSLLMLDEPFGALDAFTREELWSVMQTLWMEKRFTAILVTHDLREAAFLADRVVVMSQRPGRVIHEEQVPLPHPRTLDTTFLPEFVEIVHALRRRIHQESGQ